MNLITFDEFLASVEENNSLSVLLKHIAAACIEIAEAIEKGAQTGSMGSLESENVQGEVQKALDVITNDIFIGHVQNCGCVAGMVSEEMQESYQPPTTSITSKDQYLISFDPLDGSSNVNVNISVGTIFSIVPWESSGKSPTKDDYFKTGLQQAAAGYAMYGSSTMLVITTGNGVNGFTLDRASKQFLLTHPDLKIPADTLEFAINMSNQRHWEAPVQRYVEECVAGKGGARGVDFNMRWVASMVAEIHRILLRGGVFMYPFDSRPGGKAGKLRLLYEANPMSMIVEQAGGLSSTGRARILEIVPTDIHQRVPVILGSRNEVERVINYHKTG